MEYASLNDDFSLLSDCGVRMYEVSLCSFPAVSETACSSWSTPFYIMIPPPSNAFGRCAYLEFNKYMKIIKPPYLRHGRQSPHFIWITSKADISGLEYRPMTPSSSLWSSSALVTRIFWDQRCGNESIRGVQWYEYDALHYALRGQWFLKGLPELER